VIADQWHGEIQREANLGDRSPETVRLYRGYLDNWILSAVGKLRANEITVNICDCVVKRAQDKESYPVAKGVRAVMDANPIRSISKLVGGTRKTVVALSAPIC
jgi:hypothetical protein